MLRMLAISSFLALPLALVTLPAHTTPPTAAGPCTDLWVHHPLVVYDVTGFTLGGPVDLSLVVYDDGTAKLSSASAAPGQGKSSLVVLSQQEVLAFAQSLLQAGSFQTCDQPLVAADVPLKTLSVFRGATDAKAHTFSWWIDVGPHATFEQLAGDFIATNFPGF